MDKPSQQMIDFYTRRANEYESVYQKPERQADLVELRTMLSHEFIDQSVLEIACGTGYWTQEIARQATAILATDASREMLDIAKQKSYDNCLVTFFESDAFDLQNVSAEHQAGFLGFWWSHVPRQRINKFLESFHGKLLPGAKVILIDNRFVEGNSTPICDSDQHGNTYQFRTLQDGSEHRLLKNFYSLNELRNALTPHVKNLTVRELQYYWIAKYQT